MFRISGAPQTPKMGTQIIGKFLWVCRYSPVAASLDDGDSPLVMWNSCLVDVCSSAERSAAFGHYETNADSQQTTTLRSFVRLEAFVKSWHSFSIRFWAAFGPSAFAPSEPKFRPQRRLASSADYLVPIRPLLSPSAALAGGVRKASNLTFTIK